jgi:methyl-accepting chemotaxis protein
MMDFSPPSSQAWAAYTSFLSERWPRRSRRLIEAVLIGSALLLLADGLMLKLGVLATPGPLLGVIGLRLACLGVPLVALGLLKRLGPGRRLPGLTLGLTGLWLLISQGGFYLAGTQRTLPHAALLLWCLFFIPLVLPLRSLARGLFYAFLVMSYAVLDLTLDPTPQLAPRMLGIAALALASLSIAWSLEGVLRSLRRQFFLKQEMGSTVRTLEDSRTQVGDATDTLGQLVEKLRDSTLELSSESSRARAQTERIALASEAVARMARASSSRASGASSIVSQATGHTQRIDAEMVRVENGMGSIGVAIGHTEASLRELEAHAKQIIAFTATLQEFANQTDVLALNAAMEAARAGDAGRSFAVVAREVRKLAEASKDSSVKINEVVRGIRVQLDETLAGMVSIRENTQQFESSFTDARKTLESIRGIVTQIEALMNSTVEDANEQAVATGAISSGAGQLQSLIEAHAQMSADVAVTADKLGQLADELRALLPKKEPRAEPAGPRAGPALTPLPGTHAAVA